MKVIAIIPARYDSKRFPGKVLADIKGKSMIQRVYDQIRKSSVPDDVIVATDDQRIRDHVELFGGKVLMTGTHHRNGTERCNEAIQQISATILPDDLVINVQGDEPFLHPEMIQQLASCFESKKTSIATLIKRIDSIGDIEDPSVVKAIIDKTGRALYFSRATIPWVRNAEKKEWPEKHHFFKHIGIYAYRSGILSTIAGLPPSDLELAESLEQLRWLENGFEITTEITEYESIGIDTPKDLLKLSEDS